MKSELKQFLADNKEAFNIEFTRGRRYADRIKGMKFDMTKLSKKSAQLLLTAFQRTSQKEEEQQVEALIREVVGLTFNKKASLIDLKSRKQLPELLKAAIPNCELIAFSPKEQHFFFLNHWTKGVFEIKVKDNKLHKTADSLDEFLQLVDLRFKHDGSAFAKNYLQHIRPNKIKEEHLILKEIFSKRQAHFKYDDTKLVFGHEGCSDAYNLNYDGWYNDGYLSMRRRDGNPNDYFVLGGFDKMDDGYVYYARMDKSPMQVYTYDARYHKNQHVSTLQAFLEESSLKVPKKIQAMVDVDELKSLTINERSVFEKLDKNGDSDKIFIAELAGKALTTKSGKFNEVMSGEGGRVALKKFDTVAKAQKAYEKKVKEWSGKYETSTYELPLAFKKAVENCIKNQEETFNAYIQYEKEMELLSQLTHVKELVINASTVALLEDFSVFKKLEALEIWARVPGKEKDGSTYMIPKSIGTLKTLKHFKLNASLLNDADKYTLPDSLGDLDNLIELNLSTTIKVPEALARLKKLKALKFYIGGYSNKNNALPEVFSKISSLEIFIANGFGVKEIPDSYLNLTNLKVLDLEGNKITKIPENIGNLSQLEIFDMSYYNGYIYDGIYLETPIPASFFRLKNLKKVNFDNLGFIDSLDTLMKLKAMGSKVSLKEIRVKDVPKEEEQKGFDGIIDYLSIQEGESEEFYYSHYNGNEHEQVCQITYLKNENKVIFSQGRKWEISQGKAKREEKTFENKELSKKFIDKKIKNLEKKGFILTSEDFSAEIIYKIKECKKTQSPKFHSSEITEKILDTIFEELTHLQHLVLNVNDTPIPSTIQNLSQLKKLKIITDLKLDQLPEEIGTLQQLEDLYLEVKHSQEAQALPEWMTQLTQLKVFNLYNSISISLPKGIENMKSLEYFHNYNGNITAIPKEIAQLDRLRVFKAKKIISNELPKEMVTMPSLEVLDVKLDYFEELPYHLENKVGIFQKLGFIDKKVFPTEKLNEENKAKEADKIKAIKSKLASYVGQDRKTYIMDYFEFKSDEVPILEDIDSFYSYSDLIKVFSFDVDNWTITDKRLFALLSYNLWCGKSCSSKNLRVRGFGVELFETYQKDPSVMDLDSLIRLLRSYGKTDIEIVYPLLNAIESYLDEHKQATAMGRFVLEQLEKNPQLVSTSIVQLSPAVAFLKLLVATDKLDLIAPYLADFFATKQTRDGTLRLDYQLLETLLEVDKNKYEADVILAFKKIGFAKDIAEASFIIHKYFGDKYHDLLSQRFADAYYGVHTFRQSFYSSKVLPVGEKEGIAQYMAWYDKTITSLSI